MQDTRNIEPRKTTAGKTIEVFMARSFRNCAASSGNSLGKKQLRCRSDLNEPVRMTPFVSLDLREKRNATSRDVDSFSDNREQECEESEQKWVNSTASVAERKRENRHERYLPKRKMIPIFACPCSALFATVVGAQPKYGSQYSCSPEVV